MLMASEGRSATPLPTPRTQMALFLMTHTSGGVADKQLEEIHVVST